MKRIKSWFYPALLLLIALLLLRYFFRPGIFTAHDIENHLARIGNFASALKAGQFPVRWAGGLNHKFGYPVFNFNYPLPNILALPLMLFGFSIQASLKIILFASYYLSGLFFYLWIKKYVGALTAFTSAVFYLTFPYQLIDIYVRGVVGENITLFLFPAVLYGIDRLVGKLTGIRFLTVVILVLLFSLSHNIYVLLFAPLILAYLFWKKQAKSLNLKWSFLAVINGFLLSSFFWVPAIWEKQYINLTAFDPSSFYQDHFIYFKQFLFGQWEGGYSVLGPNDSMPFLLGWPAVMTITASFGFLLHKLFKKAKLPTVICLSLLAILLLIFLMTPSSQFLWKRIPLLGYVQFPWRLLGLVGWFSAVLAAALFKKVKNYLKWATVFIFVLLILPFTYPFGWEQKPDSYFFEFPFTTTTRHENTPIWFSEDNIISLSQAPVFHSNEKNTCTVLAKTSHRWKLECVIASSGWIAVHQAYFPGWQADIDGIKTLIEYRREGYLGLMSIDIPVGKHIVEFKFTENTPARIVGDSISIISMVGLFYILLKLKR